MIEVRHLTKRYGDTLAVDDLKFCEELAAKVGVGAVPGSSFFREPVNHLIRFHFAKKDETLNDALNRLEALRSKIPARVAR